MKEDTYQDFIQNAPEKKAQAIIDFRGVIIEHMDPWDHLAMDPKATEKQKEKIKNQKRRAYVEMIKAQANFSMDYTCK
jgi:hypothetical protein